MYLKVGILVIVVASGCTRSDLLADSARADSLARARQDSVNRAQPGYVIDSILPPEEEARRFRSENPGDTALVFANASSSRSDLVRKFIVALAAKDTNTLRALALQSREFSDLYYPDSPYSRPPYQQPMRFAWRLIHDPSADGLHKLIERVAGTQVKYVSEKCDPNVEIEGATKRYPGCLVTITDPKGDTVTKRYFGSIVERDGRFKFLGYSNDF